MAMIRGNIKNVSSENSGTTQESDTAKKYKLTEENKDNAIIKRNAEIRANQVVDGVDIIPESGISNNCKKTGGLDISEFLQLLQKYYM